MFLNVKRDIFFSDSTIFKEFISLRIDIKIVYFKDVNKMRFSQLSWTVNGKHDERNLQCFIHSKHPYLLNEKKLN